MTDQHESWHTGAECIYAVQRRFIFQFFFKADGRHLKNRKIALSHDDAERVSPAHLSSWIFIINFFSTACVREKPVLYHCAKFRGDRPYVCRDAAIFAIGFTR